MWLLFICIVSFVHSELQVSLQTTSGQLYAQEFVTFHVYSDLAIETTNFSFHFGDSQSTNSSLSHAMHTYHSEGRYIFVITATDGLNFQEKSLSLLVQPKRGCYEFKLCDTLPCDFGSYNILVVPLGGSLRMYCQIADANAQASTTLSQLYAALGESPTIMYDTDSFSITRMIFNNTLAAWEGVVTSRVGGSISVLVNPKGISVLGCYVRQTSLAITSAKFVGVRVGVHYSQTIDPHMILAPFGSSISQEPCSASTVTWIIAINSSNTLLAITDDTFGPNTQLRNIQLALPNGTCLLDFDCSIYDVKFFDGDLVFLTSHGLVAAFSRSQLHSYEFSKITLAVPYIDQGGFTPTSVTLMTSYLCEREFAYVYVVFFTGITSGVIGSSTINGPWVIVASSAQLRYISAVWLFDLHLHLLLANNGTSTYTLLCSNTVCTVDFIFPSGEELTGMVWHSSGIDILVYGNSVWHYRAGSLLFHKLTTLPVGEMVIMVTTTREDLGYAILTSASHIFYGKLAVADVVLVPRIDSARSAIMFDAFGNLYSVTATMQRYLLPVATFISSSDYTINCPLALKFLTDNYVKFYTAGIGVCSFAASVTGRILELTAGGRAFIFGMDSNQVLLGKILAPFQPHSNSQVLDSALFLRLGESIQIQPVIQLIADGWYPSDVGSTVTFRLGSIYISTYVNSTVVTGELVGCVEDTLLCVDWIALLHGDDVHSYANLLLRGIQGVLEHDDTLHSAGATRQWRVPAGKWSIYDFSKSTKYSIIPACSYDYTKSVARTHYLDVGDTFLASFYAPPVDVEMLVSNPAAIRVDVFATDNNGFKIITVSVSGHRMVANSTLLIRPVVTSLACAWPGTSLRVIQACDPNKQLQLEPQIHLEYMILPVNYRPPSAFGRAIPTSNNIYHADPSKPRYFDEFKLSKATGNYKQCKDKSDLTSCGCTETEQSSGFEVDSDCTIRILKVPWRQIFVPQLVLGGNYTPFVGGLTYTLRELNGRTDYCFNSSNVDCTSTEDMETFMLSTANPVGIQFTGAELFHFRATLQNPSFCTLYTEFVVWADNPPLPQFLVWVVVSCAAIFIALLLFSGFLVYSYLYNSDQ